jgi:hypothetical protein
MIRRVDAVCQAVAFRHAYPGYVRAFWTYHELPPSTQQHEQFEFGHTLFNLFAELGLVCSFNRWDMIVVDLISTMKLMGLHPEYGHNYVLKKELDTEHDGYATSFEW